MAIQIDYNDPRYAKAVADFEDANETECPGNSAANRKWEGPNGLMIDIRERGWDEQIKARTTLLQAVPESAS